MVNLIRIILLSFTGMQGFLMISDYSKAKRENRLEDESCVKAGIAGMIGNFFDTLGVSSFAVIIAMGKVMKMKFKDKELPAMLNVSCAIPNITEALIFLTAIEVDPTTLVSMLIAAGMGSYIGAGIVEKLDEKKIQLAMGIALFITATVIFMGLPWVNLLPVGGSSIGLSGSKLFIGVTLNFIYGALMTAGIGLYAPCMATTYILGMSPKCAFPIMMGSCAVLMPIASTRFIKDGHYPRKTSIWITIGGVVGVFAAAYIFNAMPMNMVKVLCVFVIYYTSYGMLKKAFNREKTKLAEV
ncbi:sulfite exporter TauE/SafE family protein [Peptacetobacter sp. AB845]|uniref:sulfite exporter TauE/SafE family protein n=1 Tax=Peptacetobacter sp. AB845 TaxID=3388429 RepID=UPI0039C9A42C